jgi:hypothetical protein
LARRTLVDSVQADRTGLGLAGQLRLFYLRSYRCAEGVTFLGFRLFPDRVRLARANVVRARRRFKEMQRLYAAGLITGEAVDMSVAAWVGHAMHGDTWRLRERVHSDIVLTRSSP